jgi:hypothetical protein
MMTLKVSLRFDAMMYLNSIVASAAGIARSYRCHSDYCDKLELDICILLLLFLWSLVLLPSCPLTHLCVCVYEGMCVVCVCVCVYVCMCVCVCVCVFSQYH